MTKRRKPFTESVDFVGSRLDREAGIVRGVKLLGHESRRGRLYPAETMRAAVKLYEGRPVNIDHTVPGQAFRSVTQRFGKTANVEFRESDGGIFGDVYYLKTHPQAACFEEAVERQELNGAMGFSQAIEPGKTSWRGSKLVVESIAEVKSLDLVADPATTNGLFESEDAMDYAGEEMAGSGPASPDMTWDLFVSKARDVFDGDGDAAAKAKKIGALAKVLFKLADTIDAALADKAEPAPAEAPPAAAEAAPAHDPGLQESLEAARAKVAAYELLCGSKRYPRSEWVEAVCRLPEGERAAFVESLPAQPVPEKPVSGSPAASSGDGAKDAKEFAKRIKLR